MKSNLTEIVFILDRSGSMHGIENDTMGGYNSFLETQRNVEGEAKVTTVLFNNQYRVLYKGIDINKVDSLTEKEYFACGSTALLDAVGKTIIDVGARLRDTAEDERPSKVIFVIITDGHENASREFTYEKVNEMISHQQNKYNWEFIFLGANIDAVKEAKNLGLKESRAVNYVADSHGTGVLYCSLSKNVASYRNTGKLDDNWSEDIKKDTDKRKKKR